VHCPQINNGSMQCSSIDDEVHCTFLCNNGYQLQGPHNGTCLRDNTWSDGIPECVELSCSTSPPLDNSQVQFPCDTHYQSVCTTTCIDGYVGDGGHYVCDTAFDGNLTWNGSTRCDLGKSVKKAFPSKTKKNLQGSCYP